jgi:hypothetical protein
MKKSRANISALQMGSKPKIVASGDSAEIAVYLPGFPQEKNSAFREDFMILPVRPPVTPTRRLVVLVPGGELKEDELGRKIWLLASKASLEILYVALSPDLEFAALLKRRLITLAASTTYANVRANTKILNSNNWAKVLEEVVRPGDLLVSIARHQAPYRFIGRKSLGEVVSTSFNLPVYMLGGMQVGQLPLQSNMVKSFVGWSLSIATIIAFGVFQIGFGGTTSDPEKTILLCLSLIIEGFLIWKINEWLG